MIIGVLASGEGTTLQAVLDACADGRVPAIVGAVISNNSGSGALRRAASAGIAHVHISSRTHPEPTAVDAAIRAFLLREKVNLIVLAGFMKKLGPQMLSEYRGRILNTHPALLPKFGGPGMFGLHVHRAVLASGDPVSGASVHLVTAEYDAGPLLAQRSVDVRRDDTAETLAARVQATERELLVDVVRELAAGVRRLPPLSQSLAPDDTPA